MIETREPMERGKLVQLKSCGPAMTVRDVGEDAITCRWFSGEILKEKAFFAEELRAAQLPYEERLAEARRAVDGRSGLRNLARAVLLMAEKAERDGTALPKEIADLLESAEKPNPDDILLQDENDKA